MSHSKSSQVCHTANQVKYVTQQIKSNMSHSKPSQICHTANQVKYVTQQIESNMSHSKPSQIRHTTNQVKYVTQQIKSNMSHSKSSIHSELGRFCDYWNIHWCSKMLLYLKRFSEFDIYILHFNDNRVFIIVLFLNTFHNFDFFFKWQVIPVGPVSTLRRCLTWHVHAIRSYFVESYYPRNQWNVKLRYLTFEIHVS